MFRWKVNFIGKTYYKFVELFSFSSHLLIVPAYIELLRDTKEDPFRAMLMKMNKEE